MNYHGYDNLNRNEVSSGAKTCLLAGLFGVFALAVLGMVGVGGLVYLVIQDSKESVARQDDFPQQAGGVTGQPRVAPRAQPRITVDQIKAPKNAAEALSMLGRQEWEYHQVAAKWLKSKPIDTDLHARISAALLKSLKNDPGAARSEAFDAFEKWAHTDSAIGFAETLRLGQGDNNRRLAILTRLKNPSSAGDIAKLLESTTDAPEALETLKSLGKEAAGAVLPFVNSKKPLAAKYAKELLDYFGVDAQTALITSIAQRLQDTDNGNDDEALKDLRQLSFDEASQGEISAALGVALGKGGFDVPKVLEAMEVWGDESCLAALHEYLAKETFVNEGAYDVAAKIKDPSSVPVLVTLMQRFGVKPGPIADCLILFGNEVAADVLVAMNHDDAKVREAVSRYVSATDVDESLLIDQCVVDLKDGKEKVVANAFKWLGKLDRESLDLPPAKSNEIASAMAVGVERCGHFEKKNAIKVFCEWATANQLGALVKLTGEPWEDQWLPAVRRMIELNEPDKTAQPIANLLTEFSKRTKTGQELRSAGPIVEDLALVLIEGMNDEDALAELCIVLGMNGTEKSLIPLNDLTKRATRSGSRKARGVIDQSKAAILAIKQRAAAARSEEESGESDDQ